MEQGLEQGRISRWEANGFSSEKSYVQAAEFLYKAKQLEVAAAGAFDAEAKEQYLAQAADLRARAKAVKEGQPSMTIEDRLAKRMAQMEERQKGEQPEEALQPEKEHTEVVEAQEAFSNEVTEQVLRHDPMDKLRGDAAYVRGVERERALEKYLGQLEALHESGKLFSGFEAIRTVDGELSTIVEKVMYDKDMDEVAAAIYIGARWRDDAISAYSELLGRENDPQVVQSLKSRVESLRNTKVDWKVEERAKGQLAA